MGDPKRLRKKYSTPMHPWNRLAIDEERQLLQEYGLKKKKEIFIASSFLKKYKNQAKKLIAVKTAQGEKERKQMLDKLQRLGLLPAGAKLDGVLSLKLRDVLERRIQSRIVRTGLAKTMNQARQMVTHHHIAIGGEEITSPSYLASLEEESTLSFKGHSPFADTAHPERVLEQTAPLAEEKPAAKRSHEETKTTEART